MLGDLVQTTTAAWITTWHCRTCDQTVYGPPRNTHCTALEGPAVVRISNIIENSSRELT